MFIIDSAQIPAQIMDANESIFFLRELESVKSRSYDVKYRNLKANALVPVSTEGDPGAAVITYQQYTKVGVAKIIADYADDVPRADVYGIEVSKKVYPVNELAIQGMKSGALIWPVKALIRGVPMLVKEQATQR